MNDAKRVASNIVTGLCVKRAQCFGFNENEWLETEIADAIATQPAWQPIETAPKDGTEVILFHPPENYQGIEYPARVTAGSWIEWDETPECDGGSIWMSLDGGFREDTPTHWLPLPKIPASP